MEHEWYSRPLPDNVSLDPTAYLHSSYAFNRYRSEQPCGVSVAAHTGVYATTMFELGPSGSVRVGRHGLLNGPQFITNGSIVIGDYCYLSYEVYLADDSWPDLQPRHPADDPSIVLGDDCWVGMRSVLLGGTRLGQGVIVGAGSVVDSVIPAYSIVAGNPARVVGTAPPGTGRASR